MNLSEIEDGMGPDARPIQVWELNEFDWFAGSELSECVNALAEETGLEVDEVLDDRYRPRKLTNAEVYSIRMLTDEGQSILLCELIETLKSTGAMFPRRVATRRSS